MKKHMWMTFACLLFCGAMLVGCTNHHTSVNKSPQKAERSVIVYEMTYEEYLEFINSPSIHNLNSLTTKYEYSVDENNNKINRKELDGNYSVESLDEGVFRISYLPVYASLIDTWSDTSQVQHFLSNHRIDGDIDELVFLSCYRLPCSIGIRIDSEWYFVTINECIEDYEQNIHTNSYDYRLYTHNEIINKYITVDADLYINGEIMLSARMHYDYAEIPILHLIELLGAEVQWYGDTVTVEYNSNAMKIDLATKTIAFDDKELYGEAPPGGVSLFLVQGSEIYLDSSKAADVLREFGVEMSWSRESGAVYVMTHDTGDGLQ